MEKFEIIIDESFYGWQNSSHTTENGAVKRIKTLQKEGIPFRIKKGKFYYKTEKNWENKISLLPEDYGYGEAFLSKINK